MRVTSPPGHPPFPDTGPDVPDDVDEEISLLDEIADAGGPDLR
ncbi:hypothetical protein RB628_13830 [Streptomyces sp. ADMS]|nr:hypothetical protein [Streptomyces sp. ADMS]MDW4906387.1 hypothetical protein [Streptomyces sp. ADMS]